MRTFPKLWLGLSILLGFIWIYPIQTSFLRSLDWILAGPAIDFEATIDQGIIPSFLWLWLCCIFALCWWMLRTRSSRPLNNAEVRATQAFWWRITSLLVAIGLLFQFFFTFVTDYKIPFPGRMLLTFFVILDVLLLFWLPTLLASPRSYRLVVPGAVRLFGGR
jgi:hypothetical protein